MAESEKRGKCGQASGPLKDAEYEIELDGTGEEKEKQGSQKNNPSFKKGTPEKASDQAPPTSTAEGRKRGRPKKQASEAFGIQGSDSSGKEDEEVEVTPNPRQKRTRSKRH